MEEQIKQISERLKGLRDIKGLSTDDMAKQLNIPVKLYQDYENGIVDIPVSFLYNIAHQFKLDLSTLLTGEEPRLHTYSLTRKGKGVSVERRKEYKYQNLAHNFIHKKAEPFLVTVDPEVNETQISLNSHPGQEFDYVLEGTLMIMIGSNELVLNEGDSVFYDSTVCHGMKALNGKPVKFLAIII